MPSTLLFFARARDLAGTDRARLEGLPPATVGELRRVLLDRYPALAPIAPHLLIAVNQAYAQDSASIPDGAEIAVFPPVSGG